MGLNIIEKLFPKWAAKRQYFKNVLKASKERSYKAGQSDRLNSWEPVNASAESVDKPYRSKLRARARYLERNSDTAEAIIGALERNVVGTGIKPQARVKTRDGEFNKKVNDALEAEFKRWIRQENCDITEQQTFYEIQRMILRRRIVDGEILVRRVTDSNSEFPLKIQSIEADLLDSSFKVKPDNSENYIVSGVEVNDYYKPIAYHIQQQSPDGFTSFKSQRISADKIMHLFRKRRPTQVRGVSELANVIDQIKDTDDYLEAELIAARIAASFAAFVTKQGSKGMGRMEEDDDGNKIEKIYPGMIEYLNPGEDVKFAEPDRNAEGVSGYIKVQDRRAASGMGLSYEVVSRDMTEASYSSARQNHLEDRKTWIPLQHYMINHFCRPIWEEFVRHCALSGRVNMPGFFNEPERYYKCDWIAPGWTWIDPLKDVRASKEEVKAGMKNIAEIAAAQGRDWQEVLEQAKREKEYAEELGLNLDVYGGDQENAQN